MPADLKAPFSESCCDGGICDITALSCQPCGCDAGAKWICQRHQTEASFKALEEELRIASEDYRRSLNGKG